VTAVRYAVESDLPALTEIYNHYVVNTPATFDLEPFTVESRRAWFSHYRTSGRHRLVVAERDDHVVGYASSSQFRVKPAYDTSVEVTVYLHPEATGGGIGSVLYRRLFDELGTEDIHRAYAGIAMPNDASLALHRKFGFVEMGTMTEVGRKFGKWWDVLWMERSLAS
jgi:phosphinothricin acetyltransferase